jgi:hypothetical protein
VQSPPLPPSLKINLKKKNTFSSHDDTKHFTRFILQPKSTTEIG